MKNVLISQVNRNSDPFPAEGPQGKYQLEDEVARGAFGAVYEASLLEGQAQPKWGFAVKWVEETEEGFTSDAIQEAKLMRKFNHEVRSCSIFFISSIREPFLERPELLRLLRGPLL